MRSDRLTGSLPANFSLFTFRVFVSCPEASVDVRPSFGEDATGRSDADLSGWTVWGSGDWTIGSAPSGLFFGLRPLVGIWASVASALSFAGFAFDQWWSWMFSTPDLKVPILTFIVE